ncbi:hypothetical protein [Marinicrinis sediminis]|uniref:OTU domain-containing protein n=1 Tax=Marinicrinis sediminis TaxID=1652465 RepID=A0ABW5R9X3_9BACL
MKTRQPASQQNDHHEQKAHSKPDEWRPPSSAMHSSILQWQRTAGNQAAYQLMQARQATTRLQTPPVRTGTSEPPKQLVRVKKKTSHGKETYDYYVPATDRDTDAEDTLDMPLSKKREVLHDLQNKGKNVKANASAIQELTKEINIIGSEVSESEIIQLGVQLDQLLVKKQSQTGLEESDNKQINNISSRLLRALDFLGTLDQGEKAASSLRILLQAQMKKINELDDKAIEKAQGLAERTISQVTPAERAAYREDIRRGGVWGGGAETAVIASTFGMYVDLYILDGNGQYIQADRAGDLGGTQAGFSILNVGNHYVVITNGHANGSPFRADSHQVFDPEPDGDCMFNALHYALTNGNRSAALTYQQGDTQVQVPPEEFVARARTLAADGMTDDMVDLSVEEILLSDQVSGVGAHLGRLLDYRKYHKGELTKRMHQSKLEESHVLDMLKMEKLIPSSFSKSLDELMDIFQEKFEQKPEMFHRILTTILKQIDQQFVGESEVLHQGPDAAFEYEQRKEKSERYRRQHAVVNSPHNDKQLVITIEGAESQFVIDRIGQLVPRFVARSISAENIAEKDNHHHIYPSGMSPEGKPSKSGATGSGISDNKVEATPEMLHVEGKKPSGFLSTTKDVAGTINPKGESFGSALYMIDLSYLNPAHIADLSSGSGISYYLLGNYDEKKGGTEKKSLISKAASYNDRQVEGNRMKKENPKTKDVEFTAQDAEKDDQSLSGKEWQAIMDVIRTSEVLISDKIPEEALSKPNQSDKK